MAERKLCSWKPGEIISAQHLNLMTCVINANADEIKENTQQLSQLTQSSFNAVGGLPDGRYISTLNEEFLEARRGVIIDGWDYKVESADEQGVYIRTSGVENALKGDYPDESKWIKLGNPVDAITKEIIEITKTDEYGNIKGSCTTLMDELPLEGNCLWAGAVLDCKKPPEGYKFYRRLGRVIHSCFEMSEGSNPAPKILNTNDLVMPILPARTEVENYDPERHHTVSLLGEYKGNSFLIKNIANAGGMRFNTSCPERIAICSGVEFHKACITECKDCSTGCIKQEVKWPEIQKHLEPNNFDITVACIPIVEQVYTWDYPTSSWVPKTCGDCIQKPECKGTIKIQAKTLCNKNWMIGWSSNGKITIPVKDFNVSSETNYEAGRGINLCSTTKTIGDGDDAQTVEVTYICNTMKLCAGCGVKICEVCQKGPVYKLHAPASKLTGCRGIIVHQKATNDWLVSDQLTISGGTGIIAKRNANDFNVCLDLNAIKHTTVSAGCGVCVVKNGSDYRVSIKTPCHTEPIEPGATYTFDPEWFTVTGNNVTLNETKIQTIGNEIAANASSSITPVTTATIDVTDNKGVTKNIVATITNSCATDANAVIATVNG